MSRSVTFEKLWLLSERDRRGRCLSLSPRTLLHGPNGTGKSRLTKSLFWALGCNVRKLQVGAWDPDTIAVLEFSFSGQKLSVLRQRKALGLFDETGNLLFGASNMSAWEDHIARLFGYRLRLPRPGTGSLAQAGMDYLTIPFYLDQDGSWQTEWATYEQLNQFSNWKTPTFSSFLGIKPNAYFEAKYRRDDVGRTIQTKYDELNAQRTAFQRVKEHLPKNLPTLNVAAFRAELIEIARNATKVRDEQVSVRARLTAAVSARERLRSELTLATRALEESRGDLTYLSSIDESSIQCPTCGTQHENSFHARVQLSQDVESMSALVAELKGQLREAYDREQAIRRDLDRVERQVAQLEEKMSVRHAHLRLDDVLATQSKRTLDAAFESVYAKLRSSLDERESEYSELGKKLKEYEDRNRQKEVSGYYAAQVQSLSNALHVPTDEQLAAPKPGARARSGGSSGPRSQLAIHLAMLATNANFGDTPLFPFVVDTPAQSGQDEENLSRMMTLAATAILSGHQVILAVERIPDGVSLDGFQEMFLRERKSALIEDEFFVTAERVREPLALLHAYLKERR